MLTDGTWSVMKKTTARSNIYKYIKRTNIHPLHVEDFCGPMKMFAGTMIKFKVNFCTFIIIIYYYYNSYLLSSILTLSYHSLNDWSRDLNGAKVSFF